MTCNRNATNGIYQPHIGVQEAFFKDPIGLRVRFVILEFCIDHLAGYILYQVLNINRIKKILIISQLCTSLKKKKRYQHSTTSIILYEVKLPEC